VWLNSLSSKEATDRRYGSEIPRDIELRVRTIDLVVFDPFNVWLKVAENDAPEGHCVAHERRLVVWRLLDDRRVRVHGYERMTQRHQLSNMKYVYFCEKCKKWSEQI